VSATAVGKPVAASARPATPVPAPSSSTVRESSKEAFFFSSSGDDESVLRRRRVVVASVWNRRYVRQIHRAFRHRQAAPHLRLGDVRAEKHAGVPDGEPRGGDGVLRVVAPVFGGGGRALRATGARLAGAPPIRRSGGSAASDALFRRGRGGRLRDAEGGSPLARARHGEHEVLLELRAVVQRRPAPPIGVTHGGARDECASSRRFLDETRTESRHVQDAKRAALVFSSRFTVPRPPSVTSPRASRRAGESPAARASHARAWTAE